MKYCKLLLIFVFIGQLLNGQDKITTRVIAPATPNVASLLKFGEIPVSKYTGIPEVTIPIFTIKGKNIELPLSLQYHAGGIRVTEAASWVGLGWALNAGGVIHQTINGKRDDGSYGRSTPEGSNLISDLISPSFCDLYFVVDGNADSEPDMFNFSFNGKSGQFYLDKDKKAIQIPEQKLKIEFVSGAWKITDLDGTQYFFEAIEQAVSINKTIRGETVQEPGGGAYATVTQLSYMLTKIVQTNAELITFEYENSSTVDYIFNSESINFYNNLNGSMIAPGTADQQVTPLDFLLLQKNFTLQTALGGKRIKSIVFSEGKIEFLAGLNRCDLYGDKFLDKIVVYNTSNLKIRELDLGYKYFVGNVAYTTAELNCTGDAPPNIEAPGSNYHNYYKDRRLFLTSVDEVDANNIIGASYIFDYENTIGLPDRFSAQQDWWGLYNGNLQTSLLQNLHKTNQYVENSLYNGYDILGRNPDLLYAKQGSLKKITYPTGGSTEFEFELNSLTTSFGPTYINHPEITYTASGQNNNQLLGNIFVNDISGSASIPFYVEPCIFGGGTNGTVGFYIADVNNNVIISSVQVTTDLGINRNVNYTLNNGQYKIYSYAAATFYCTYNIKVLNWTDQPPLPDNKDYGGLRTKKITNYDPQTNKKLFKVFDYTELVNGKYLSTGKSSINLDKFKNNNVFGQILYIDFAEGPGMFTPTEVSGKFLALTSNTNYPLSTNQNGFIGYSKVKEKSIDAGNNDLGYLYYEFTDESDYITGSTFLRGYDFFTISGTTPNAPVHSANWKRGKPLLVQNYLNIGNGTYKCIKSEKYRYSFYSSNELPTRAFVATYAIKSLVYSVTSQCPNTNGGGIGKDQYKFTNYTMPLSSYQFLDSVITEEIDANNNKITIKKAYEYNMQNFLPSKITTSNSVSGNSIQIIKYPKDYTDVTATDPVSQGIKALQNNYAINTPVEQTIQKVVNNVNIGTLNSILTTFKSVNLQPDKIYALELISPINDFTVSGVQSGAITKDFRYKEKISFNQYDAVGNLLEQQKTNDLKEVYLYGYNSSYPVAKIVNTTYDIAKTYITQSILDNPLSTDAAMRAELNKIRTGLANSRAFVTTFTYKPLVGMTSQTDPNNKTTYYEYDAFNRLSIVRDQDIKIIKKICYNYLGQPGACTTFGNGPQSGTFTKNNCTSGTGTQVTYTVPANTYSSSSQIAADALAQNDISTNGQNYANQNGTCSSATVTVSATSNESTPFYMTFTNNATGQNYYMNIYPYSNNSIQIPAGEYTVNFNQSGYAVSTYFSISYYGTYGTSATFYSVSINSATEAQIGY